MKAIYIILFSFFFINVCSAQFGVSARYTKNTNKTWDNTYQSASTLSTSLFTSGTEIGLNYWFRLKNYRVEFLPEISYASSKSDNLPLQLDVISHDRTSYHFNLNVQVYPLDFDGDCDCPTWSKDGNIVKKGFYWLFSPGIVSHTINSELQSSPDLTENAKITSFRIGLGAGLDIGIGDLLTISPFALYSQNFGNSWKEQISIYDLETADLDNSSKINQWHFGMRFLFRPDYKN